MTNQKFTIGCTLIIATFLQFISFTANAVAFKLKNSTPYAIRAKVFDRGNWRSYVSISPGQCKVFGESVTRSEHSVVIQMKTEEGWKTIYKDNHGSRMMTRIVRVVESDDGYYFAWYDEPPGCRDCPDSDGHGCLYKSGWVNLKNAIKVGKFLGKAVLKAEGKQEGQN